MEVRGLRSSFSLSLIAHVFFVLACALMMRMQSAKSVAQHKLTWIELDPESAIKSRSREEERIRKQIVQTEKGRVTDKAAPDAFLGEKTQIVDRETVSSRRTTEMGKQRAQKLVREQKAQKARSQAESSPKEEPRTASPLASLGIALPMPKAKAAQSESEALAQEQALQADGSPQDYVKGMRESERTALNTKEYIFYGYFQRIRERLDRAWVPILREKLDKLWRSGRHLASDMDHQTKLMVILDEHGDIVRIKVIGESGTHDLDEAAVRAFNQAGPFPNPPRGIVDRDGEVKIPWEFVLKS